jgi:hypothetical protein
MVIQKSEETRTLAGFHGGLRRGTAAAALGAVLVLSAGVPASNAVSLAPSPDTTDSESDTTASVEADGTSLELWASVVLGPKPDPTRPAGPGTGKQTPPGQRTQPSPSPAPTPSSPAPSSPAPSSPAPLSPSPSSPAPSPSGTSVPPSATPGPPPASGAAAPAAGPAKVPGTPAAATGAAPAAPPAAPPFVLPATAAPEAPWAGSPRSGATLPGIAVEVPAAGGARHAPGGRTTGPAAAAPASAWTTTNRFGPANMAILTSAGAEPLSGSGYGISGTPVMRPAISISPLGEMSPQVWWGAGLVALACAAGVAYVRMRRT